MSKTVSGFSKLNKLEKIDWLVSTYFNNENKVKQILHFSPTHKDALIAYLDWLSEHGKRGGQKDFVRSFLAEYPNSGYRDLFLNYLTNDKNVEIDYDLRVKIDY